MEIDQAQIEQAEIVARKHGKNENPVGCTTLQRHMRIGFARAMTLLEELHRRGIVSAPMEEHHGKRLVLPKS